MYDTSKLILAAVFGRGGFLWFLAWGFYIFDHFIQRTIITSGVDVVMVDLSSLMCGYCRCKFYFWGLLRPLNNFMISDSK